MYIYICIYIYYMDKGILLATKTLVESIRHYIRDPSGVFFASGISINSRLFCCCFFQNGRRVQGFGVERRRH